MILDIKDIDSDAALDIETSELIQDSINKDMKIKIFDVVTVLDTEINVKSIGYANYTFTDRFTGINHKSEILIPEYIPCHQCNENVCSTSIADI